MTSSSSSSFSLDSGYSDVRFLTCEGSCSLISSFLRDRRARTGGLLLFILNYITRLLLIFEM